jgi:hypothetical protein
MNLYNYHNKPESLIGHRKRHVMPPEEAYRYLMHSPAGDDKQIAVQTISKNAPIALKYAMHISHNRFPEGEVAIAKYGELSKDYAEYVLLPLYNAGKIDSPRFYKGEAAILKSEYCIYSYTKYIMNGSWSEGEAAIASGAADN